MAVPLLLDVFTAINYNAKQKWFRQPANVLTREVCAESGQIPISICKHRTTDFYIHHISSQEACNLYQKIPISEDGAFQYCPICQPLNGYILKTYPIYPPEVALWQRNNQVGIDVPPPHYPKCAGILGGEGPKILSPTSDSEYFLEENNPQQLLLQAAADAGVSQLHWYINGQFLKTSPAQEKVFITPPAGNLHVACVDDKGRKSEVTVKIVRY
jgi:penicillin-binding protein 1C